VEELGNVFIMQSYKKTLRKEEWRRMLSSKRSLTIDLAKSRLRKKKTQFVEAKWNAHLNSRGRAEVGSDRSGWGGSIKSEFGVLTNRGEPPEKGGLLYVVRAGDWTPETDSAYCKILWM